MHAFLAFSASNLAWISKSTDARKIQIQHGGIALRGLHDAISSFSRSNADAVLAASILLMTQANDWYVEETGRSSRLLLTPALQAHVVITRGGHSNSMLRHDAQNMIPV